ncbi:MAG: DUF1871 family protein [Candidatus Binatia bacterium]
MRDVDIQEVAKILAEWNPLGEQAATVLDSDGYKTQAIDILFELSSSDQPSNPAQMVQEVLNEAFDLSLPLEACLEPTRKILGVLLQRY